MRPDDRAALEASGRWRRLNLALSQRAARLAAANRSLKQGLARRKSAAAALRKSGERCRTLLEESLALQKQLRLLAHQVLSAQENKRTQLSRDLRDEIAPSLLGINVRLLAAKTAAGGSARKFQKEIARTRRLVHMSLKIIERIARGYGKGHQP